VSGAARWRRHYATSDGVVVATVGPCGNGPGWWYEIRFTNGNRVDDGGWYDTDRGAKLAAGNALRDGDRSGVGHVRPIGPWARVS
jgi:hypothetical protein